VGQPAGHICKLPQLRISCQSILHRCWLLDRDGTLRLRMPEGSLFLSDNDSRDVSNCVMSV
jgi:hypothetical protein